MNYRSRITYKQRNRLFIFVVIAVGIVVVNYLNSNSTAPSPSTTSTICFATMNDIFSEFHQALIDTPTFAELYDKVSKLSGINSATAALVINKVYALKFNHRYFITNASQYNQIDYPWRHSSWLKLTFIQDILANQDCEWVSYIDSKSYYYMNSHQLSIQNFLEKISVHDTSANYNEFEYYKRQHNGRFPLELQTDSFKIGLLGLSHRNKLGHPQPTLSTLIDYASTNVFFIRNSNQGKQLINDWINGTDSMTEDDIQTYQQFSQRYGREQSVLNKVILPYYNEQVSYYSYLDFGDKSSIGIRSILTKSERMRALKLIEAIRELMNQA